MYAHSDSECDDQEKIQDVDTTEEIICMYDEQIYSGGRVWLIVLIVSFTMLTIGAFGGVCG